MKWFKWLGIAVFLGLLTGSALAATGPFGRDFNTGYFTGQPRDFVDWVFVPLGSTQYDGLGPGCDVQCTVTLKSFIKVYHDRVFDSNFVNEGRAAAEIDIMLGKQGPDFGGVIQNGIDYAQANFQQWVDLVDLYASGAIPGYTVNWNATVNFSPIDTNGMGETGFKGGDPTCTKAQDCHGDITFIDNYNDQGLDDSVVFNTPGGRRFIIKHKCANLTGDFQSLLIPPSTVKITKSSSQPNPPILVGQTMTYSIQVHEAEPIPLQQDTVTDVLPAQFKYLGPANGSPAPSSVNGQTLNWNFNSPADNAILNTIANGIETLSVQVQAVSPGNNVVNQATGTATDEFGRTLTVTPGSTTNTVLAVATPVANALNSDIHAGGGPCQGPLTSGVVQGRANAGAYSSYAISASGGIFNYNSTWGTNKLSLGSAGGYSQVCENDLYTAASAQFGQVAATTLAGNSQATAYDVSTWSAGIYYIMGNGYLRASGQVNQKLTIVVSGDAYITSNITMANVQTLRANAPSIGLISQHDINIEAPALQVYAYMFADGTIDTCLAGSGSCSNASPLNIYGFIMGKNLSFNRLGPLNASGSPVSEQVIMTPQIYLNPPTFFDAQSVDATPLNGLGEKQPLY